jgi:TetR/AcrR family transcriptional repressor of nem operon
MGNARALEVDLAAALVQSGAKGVTAQGLARHVQAVIQGAFVLAKADGSEGAAELAREELQHLRRYFELLFGKGDC